MENDAPVHPARGSGLWWEANALPGVVFCRGFCGREHGWLADNPEESADLHALEVLTSTGLPAVPQRMPAYAHRPIGEARPVTIHPEAMAQASVLLAQGGLTTTEVARAVGVSQPTIRRWIDRGLIGGEAA